MVTRLTITHIYKLQQRAILERIIKTETLIHYLKAASESAKGITFIQSGNEEEFISYETLLHRATMFLANLHDAGVRPGDQFILQVEDNQTFLTLFWACLLGNIVPVPLTLARTDEYRLKLLKVLHVLGSPHAAFDKEVYRQFVTYLVEHGQETIVTQLRQQHIFPEDFIDISSTSPLLIPEQGDTAYIQFSSGSTGDPKGIVLSHGNLVNNCRAFLAAKKTGPDDSYLSWLPLTHDMGLIGWHLNPVIAGVSHCIMPPSAFVRNPSLWFDKVDEHKITITCSPNFGLSHFLKAARISSGKSWDLSPVRLIVVGAEHISNTLCTTFLETLEMFGLRKNVLMPGYGLAEATLAVAVSPCGEEFTTHYLDITSLGVGSRAAAIAPDDKKCAAYVDEGKLLPGFLAKICDDSGNTLADGVVGHLVIKGSSIASGYINNSAATRETFITDGWLKTGDLGFISHQRIVITGRSKEIIIIGGMNFYPHDLERAVGEIREIAGRAVAVCGVYEENKSVEELVVFVSYKKDLETFVPVIKKIKEKIANNFNISVSRVIPILSIPRTTSGKIQRVKLAMTYRNGDYNLILQELNQLIHADLQTIDLAVIAPDKRLNELTRFICNQAVTLTGADSIDPDLSLFNQGFDSLMAVELHTAIEHALGATVPVSWFRKNESIHQFSAKLLATYPLSSPAPERLDTKPPLSLLEQLKDMDQMSEESIRNMIEVLKQSQK
ncbi:AMP-binding protein [Desulfopila sp. IMCC35008]|uniref:AMP-binding protein n=1 Tax=Desulfopila sp. IMCC35008 TaxID=2653858 RepID=UPI0013D47E68|nr:AMP-binding protein [Desulfopila sp. IMCC35008]